MPVGAAIGTAVGGVASGIFGSRAANHATDAQSKANEEALAYQKQLAAEEKANKQRRLDDYNAQYEAYMRQYYPNQARQIVHPVQATGAGGTPGPIQVPGAPPMAPPGGHPSAPPIAPPAAPGPASLGSMMAGAPMAAAPPLNGQGGPPDATAPKSLADWANWRNYGVN